MGCRFSAFVDKVKSLGFDLLELHAAVLESKGRSYRLKIKERADKAGMILSYGMGLDAYEEDPPKNRRFWGWKTLY
jgi:hypothetical protein